ncbi:hypothetical protein V5O48_010805 [Marasmius crinis-equi]|uniref:Uncharacterized protein n=1 Tax=Marasmius crinis-equi TaxID=585013 RepID=A0ABR3F7G7_9AGAR
MAKNMKPKAQAAGKPITDYFGRKSHPSTPQSRTATADPPSQPPMPQRADTTTAPSTSSRIPNKKRKAAGPSDADIELETPSRIGTTVSTRPVMPNAVPPTPLSPKENLLHQSSSSRLGSRKKQRLSSPDPSMISDYDEVSASQSDEKEMFAVPHRKKFDTQVPPQNMNEVKANDTEKSFSDEEYPPMDVDDTSGLFTPRSNWSLFGTEPDTSPSFPSSIVQPLTPPSSSPEPETRPPPLDSEAKTRQIIEQIRASARAKVLSSPEPDEELRMLSDSEDDDLPDMLNTHMSKDKGKGKEKEVAPHVPASEPSKYNLRQPAKKSSLSREIASLTQPAKQTKSKKASNPLADMLKEKAKADRAGKGYDALALAERTVAGKRGLQQEMDDEDDADDEMEDWMVDEDMAWKAVQDGEDGEGMDDDRYGELELDEKETKELFAEDAERGKAVAAILASDKKNREHGHRTVKRVGHPLWVVSPDDAMDVDTRTVFRNMDQYPVLRSFKAALDESNVQLAYLLLRSGALNQIDLTVNLDLLSCLCDLAVLPESNDLVQGAFYLLRNLWNEAASKPYFPFQSLVDILAKLGANVASFGWSSSAMPCRISKAERKSSLLRLIQLCTYAANARKIRPDNVFDILIALCAISLDSTTSSTIRTDILVAAHAICSSLADGTAVAKGAESTICSKALQFIEPLTPINRAHVISIFAAGSGRTLRIARWISYSLILEKTEVLEHQYQDLPPLEPLLSCLHPSGPDARLFKIHAETDYIDLGFYIQILSTALSDVPRYVAQELHAAALAKAARLEAQASPSKIERVTPPLQQAQHAIEMLHGSITDTRATHLDRSQTKEILKIVSMKLHYQRVAALKTGGHKPKNIKQYFSKKT